MSYRRWPVGTRLRDVPALSVALMFQRAQEQRRLDYLKWAAPSVVARNN